MKSYVRSSSTSSVRNVPKKTRRRPNTTPNEVRTGYTRSVQNYSKAPTESIRPRNPSTKASLASSTDSVYKSPSPSELGALRYFNKTHPSEDSQIAVENSIDASTVMISIDSYNMDYKTEQSEGFATEETAGQKDLGDSPQHPSCPSRDQLFSSTAKACSDSSDYDTDLEDEFRCQSAQPFDRTGRDVYLQQCKHLDIVPIAYLSARLGQKSIKMRHHGLGVIGAFAITKSLAKNTYVEELDLSDNGILTGGCIAFAEMLHENTFITDLTLSDNAILTRGGIAIAQALHANVSLKRLVLCGNELNDQVAKSFAEVLKHNCTLLELDLSYNKIGEQGGLYLGAGLACNYGLQALRLRWNGITAKGGVSIANSLRKNESLTLLDISWNGLSYIGCLAFGTHLAKNEILKHLDLSNNRIGVDGAAKIAPAIAIHPSLESFRVGLNPIGDEGVLHILKSVQKSRSIKLVGLEDITVCATTHQTIMELENSREITIVIGGLGGYSKGKPPPSGISVLVQFIQDHRMRLTDLFFQWDKDKSGDISKHEFERGLLATGLKMEKYQLHALVDQLDLNGDGLISFEEIVAGRVAELLGRRFERKVAVTTEEREKESIRLPKLKGF